jgi:hypothetical protein
VVFAQIVQDKRHYLARLDPTPDLNCCPGLPNERHEVRIAKSIHIAQAPEVGITTQKHPFANRVLRHWKRHVKPYVSKSILFETRWWGVVGAQSWAFPSLALKRPLPIAEPSDQAENRGLAQDEWEQLTPKGDALAGVPLPSGGLALEYSSCPGE